jgi:integrase/recombinase XerD
MKSSELNKKGVIRKAPVARAKNFKSSWSVAKDSPGMNWEEAEAAFIRSRKLGIYGASKAVKPRTVEEYRWDLKQFFDFMRNRQVTHYNQLSEKLVLDYVAHLQSNGWSRATQRKYLISLKAFFRWAERDPECKQANMPSFTRFMPRIGKEIRRAFVPSREQMQAFLGGFDKNVIWGLRDYTACAFMLDTGTRVGEICNLEEDDFRWQLGLVNLDGKTGERLVPFNFETTGRLVKSWMRARLRFVHPDCRKLFITRYGGACTPDTFRQAFSDNLKRTGLDKVLGNDTISCHTIRHYFCTMYLVNGGTLHNLQRITGHRTLETLMIYVNLAKQLTTVAEEANRVSPLSTLLNARQEQKRRMVRLGSN